MQLEQVRGAAGGLELAVGVPEVGDRGDEAAGVESDAQQAVVEDGAAVGARRDDRRDGLPATSGAIPLPGTATSASADPSAASTSAVRAWPVEFTANAPDPSPSPSVTACAVTRAMASATSASRSARLRA